MGSGQAPCLPQTSEAWQEHLGESGLVLPGLPSHLERIIVTCDAMPAEQSTAAHCARLQVRHASALQAARPDTSRMWCTITVKQVPDAAKHKPSLNSEC